MVHDDGTSLLDPVIEKVEDDLCIFDEGDYYTLRKRNEGVLKKIDKSTVTDKFWQELRDTGWTDVDIDTDDEGEDE